MAYVITLLVRCSLIACSVLERFLQALECYPFDKEEESSRSSSKLTKNAEPTTFGLSKGTQYFGTEFVHADSYHPHSTCLDQKMMTWK